MDLNINSPSYYTREYGVDDEIYWMCRELSNCVKEKNYSEIISTVGIVPIVAPKSILEKGLCKEHKRCEPRSNLAFASLQMDYDAYVKAEISEKKKMIIENILKSVKALSKRGKIDYQAFENDVKNFVKRMVFDEFISS